MGWQVDPLAKELVHVPTTPLVGAVDASQLGTHVAAVKVPASAVKVPALHELVPETVYPESHVGWHVKPLARELVHVPTAPLVGATDASQKGANTRT